MAEERWQSKLLWVEMWRLEAELRGSPQGEVARLDVNLALPDSKAHPLIIWVVMSLLLDGALELLRLVPESLGALGSNSGGRSKCGAYRHGLWSQILWV